MEADINLRQKFNLKRKLMKQICIALLAAAAMTSSAATTSEQSYTKIGMGEARGMSSDGRYAVGTDISNYFSSYLWDATTGKVDWLTDFDLESSPEKYDQSGMFSAVNKDGVIVGACKDNELMMYWDDGWDAFYQPLMSAALWKDGELTKLGIGDFSKDDFLNLEDGSCAVDLTDDGKTVVGYVMRGNTAYYTPVGWKYNDQTGEWDFSRYALLPDTDNGEIGAISADGSIAVGYAKRGVMALPVYWTSPETCVKIELTPEDAAIYEQEFNWNYAYDVSPNGEYILFTLNNIIPCVYSVKDKTYRKIIQNGDAGNLSVKSIADNGDTAGTFVYGNFFEGMSNVAFWYSYANDVFTTFDYFTGLYAPELTDLPSFETAVIKSISADGSKFFGSTGGTVWLLSTEPERRSIPKAVSNLKGVNDEAGQLHITWEPSASVPADLTPGNYNIYINGRKNATVAAGQPLECRVKDLDQGLYGIEVEQEFATADGGIMRSPRTDKLSVKVMSDFALPLFDDFASNNFDTHGWTAELAEGNIFHDLKWQYRSTDEEYNQTLTMTTIIDTDAPYTSLLTSRFIEAPANKEVYVSYAKKMMFANRDDWYLKNDFLTLELSYDGKTWQTVKDYCAADVNAGTWIYERYDLTPLAAGRKFKLRLNAHGTSDAHLFWHIDNFKVGSEDEVEAPQGVMAQEQDGALTLTWKNSIDAYEVGYHENSPILYEITLGDDEGKPIIVANKYEPAKLAPYVGKYLTSVTTFLYDNPWFGNGQPTQASILVYADGELIYEQEIGEFNNGYTFTVKLDKAIPVEAGKTYMVGMKIHDYDPQQQPIYYQVTELFEQWKSDLYSDDEGKTWKSLHEYYKNEPDDMQYWGMCVWPIRANITDEEVVYDDCVLDETLEGYMVYRDGERLNDKLVYPAYMKYIDLNPSDGAKYEVAAFYTDGDVSEKSEPLTFEKSGVKDIYADSEPLFNREADIITLDEGVSAVELYDISGAKVASAAGRILSVKDVADGIYVLKAHKDGKSVARRVLIRK